MHAIKVHVEKRLDDGLLTKLATGLREQQAPVDPETLLALEPELCRCIPLIVPGLMIDFLIENGGQIPGQRMESLKIVVGCVIAAVLYGIVHDQFTARIMPRIFYRSSTRRFFQLSHQLYWVLGGA